MLQESLEKTDPKILDKVIKEGYERWDEIVKSYHPRVIDAVIARAKIEELADEPRDKHAEYLAESKRRGYNLQNASRNA